MTIDLPGFSEPIAQSQACFRGLLEAMAHPGRIVAADTDLQAPPPLDPATGAVLLTLTDVETPVWLDPGAAPAIDWIRFHCGAPLTESRTASLSVCLELPCLGLFNWGSHEAPETSATIILQRPSLAAGPKLRLSGPGLREPVVVRLGLPEDFVRRWKGNHAAFPRGVDLIVCCGRDIAAVPRSAMVELA